MSEYLSKITDILNRIETEEKEKLEKASVLVAETIKKAILEYSSMYHFPHFRQIHKL